MTTYIGHMGKVLLGVVALAMTIFCVFDVLSAPRRKVRHLPRLVWLAVVVLVPLVGPGVWLYTTLRRSDAHRPVSRVPHGPDDDADFLRGLDRRASDPGEQELRRWEREWKDRHDPDPGDA
ncbi:MAG: PLDc N-terminal domain-containing protein [Nocardioidaceae bacterium]